MKKKREIKILKEIIRFILKWIHIPLLIIAILILTCIELMIFKNEEGIYTYPIIFALSYTITGIVLIAIWTSLVRKWHDFLKRNDIIK